MASLGDMTLTATASALAKGEYSAEDLAVHYLDAIAAENPKLGAFTFTDRERALLAARASDQRRARGQARGALDGVPIAIKANMAHSGWPYTAGLRFRAKEVAVNDAFAIARLRDAGAVLLGVTNMDEGALGADGINAWYGATENPRRTGYSAGGSSSGAAAAVTAKLCGAALGTDTIGSVRIPASFCGCAALKPSYGLVSVGGVVPVHLRFDHVGPMARCVEDLRIVLLSIAGYDNSCQVSFPLRLRDPGELHAVRIVGYAVGLEQFNVAAEVVAAYNSAIAAARKLGHRLVPVDFGPFDVARVRRAILSLCELEMWRAHRTRIVESPEDFSDGLRAFIRYGGRLAIADVSKAEQRLAEFSVAFGEIMRSLDALMLPTVACTSFPHGERRPQNTADLTSIASATGLPALSLPIPVAADALPVGLQIIGPSASDLELLQFAAQLEQSFAPARA
jgi:aspartyl-tRNA(Asn)/glutamyl-tRNA(Gln) amidotransferase subunit A